jgi:hypothetical protein
MNQTELNELSALVERRMTVRALLKEWESGAVDRPLSPPQREAVGQLLRERAEDCLRLESVLNRLAEQIDKLEARLDRAPLDEASAARVVRLQRQMKEVGESVRCLRTTIGPGSLGEAHTAALLDPYVDDSAPLAGRVRVPEGDL